MIVSLSLILYDTGLRLRCQQIATYIVTVSGCVHVAYDCERQSALDESHTVSTCNYVLVAVSLVKIVRRTETEPLYYSKSQMGER